MELNLLSSVQNPLEKSFKLIEPAISLQKMVKFGHVEQESNHWLRLTKLKKDYIRKLDYFQLVLTIAFS